MDQTTSETDLNSQRPLAWWCPVNKLKWLRKIEKFDIPRWGIIMVVVMMALQLVVVLQQRASTIDARAANKDKQNTIIAQNKQLTSQTEQLTNIGNYLAECTTPGPKTPTAEDPTTGHPCFDRGLVAQAAAVGDLRASIDCNTLYAMGVPTNDKCREVIARIEALKKGAD